MFESCVEADRWPFDAPRQGTLHGRAEQVKQGGVNVRGSSRQPRRLPAALLAVLAACASTNPRVSGPEVTDVKIQGTSELDESDIKKKILTSESGLGFWPFGEKSYFDPNAWQADLRRIERYYQAQGYYQAEVLEDEVVTLGPNRVALRVKVKEGEPTVIARVEITFLTELPAEQRSAVLRDLELKEGDVFKEEAWTTLKSLILERLRELGYAEAAVEKGEAAVDVVTREAHVRLEINPGIRYRWAERIFVSNDESKVRRERIIEQARGAIDPTEWYSESALEEAQARVFQMGVFGAVRVNRGSPDRATGKVPVIVDVREAPFRTQKVGVGMGIDQTRTEFRLSAEHTDRNFFGGLRRLTLRGKAGYAFLPSLIAVVRGNEADALRDGPVGNAVVELEQPNFFRPDLRAQTLVGVEQTLEQAFEYTGGRVKVGVIWQPLPDIAVYPSYNLEAYRLVGTARLGGSSPELISGRCLGEVDPTDGTCFIGLSYLEQVIEWDRRDNRIEPRHGFYLSLSLQEGGLGGAFTFFRALPDARYYVSFFGDRLTLASRLRLGTLIPTGGDLESPVVSRFFSGGGASNRGFDNRRLSPLQVVDVPENHGGLGNPIGLEGQTVPVGGNGLFEANLELRYQLRDDLVLAVFFDMGFVTIRRFQFGDPRYIPDHMQYAVGFGLRYRTLVGPLRLDFGRRLPFGPPLEVMQPPGQHLRYPIQYSCFGFFGQAPGYAGSPEGICAFHLSVGEAF